MSSTTLAGRVADPTRTAIKHTPDVALGRAVTARNACEAIIELITSEMEQPYDPKYGLFVRVDPLRSFHDHAVDLMAWEPRWRAPSYERDASLADRASFVRLRDWHRDFDHDWAKFAEAANQRLTELGAGIEVIGIAHHPDGGFALVFHAPEITAALERSK